MLRNHDHQRSSVGRPAIQIGVFGEPQRRAQQNRATDPGQQTVAQNHVGAETPADDPDVRESAIKCEIDSRAQVEPSALPASKRPSDVPAALVVPRVLKRRTARSANAGRRHAALRNRWESIMPPWVGRGGHTRSWRPGWRSGQREFGDQAQTVGGLKRERFTAGRQH